MLSVDRNLFEKIHLKTSGSLQSSFSPPAYAEPRGQVQLSDSSFPRSSLATELLYMCSA